MIDLVLLREHQERISTLLRKKDPSYPIDLLYELDKKLRALRAEVEQLRYKKNELAKQGKGGVTQELREASIALGKELAQKDELLIQSEKQFSELYLSCPNVPEEGLPVGGKEANKMVKEHGAKPSFSFAPKNHVDLGNKLGWFDFEAAARMAGSNFALYKGDAVKLMYALTMFMLKNNEEHGYSFVLPPYIVNQEALQVPGNFPKFKDQVYAIPADGFYLSPTAEVNLANMYRDYIFSSTELPVRMTAWSSCFRREAGSYGSHERGLIRIHQFEKVELFTISEPSQAQHELDRMIACAETILQKLNLPYRIMLLAGQDCSFSSAKTYDLEVWMPGQNAYYEVSSCSNCTDFQARRGGIRYRAQANDKPSLVNTLNGSSLALPRLMVALMENYQQEDGSIVIPTILKNYGVW